MLTITENAKNELKNILTHFKVKPDEGLRLLPKDDGKFVLALDTKLNGDQVVEYEGCKVLFIAVEYYKLIQGKTMDCLNEDDDGVFFIQ